MGRSLRDGPIVVGGCLLLVLLLSGSPGAMAQGSVIVPPFNHADIYTSVGSCASVIGYACADASAAAATPGMYSGVIGLQAQAFPKECGVGGDCSGSVTAFGYVFFDDAGAGDGASFAATQGEQLQLQISAKYLGVIKSSMGPDALVSDALLSYVFKVSGPGGCCSTDPQGVVEEFNSGGGGTFSSANQPGCPNSICMFTSLFTAPQAGTYYFGGGFLVVAKAGYDEGTAANAAVDFYNSPNYITVTGVSVSAAPPPPPPPTFSLNPNHGPIPTTTTLQGMNYQVGQTYEYCLSTSSKTCSGSFSTFTPVPSSATSTLGAIPAGTTLAVNSYPSSSSVTWYAVVMNGYEGPLYAGSGTLVASQPFQVTSPSVKIASPFGTVGSTIQVTGSGFQVSTKYSVCITSEQYVISVQNGEYGCDPSAFPIQVTSSASGTIAATTFTIGDIYDIGADVLYAGTPVGWSLFTQISPTVAASPIVVSAGSSVTISGRGYTPGVQYTSCFVSSGNVCSGPSTAFDGTAASSGPAVIPPATSVAIPSCSGGGQASVYVYYQGTPIAHATVTVAALPFKISFNVAPLGSGTTSPTGTQCYASGATFPLTASAQPGYVFSTWQVTGGNILTLNNGQYTVRVTGSGSVTADFIPSVTLSQGVPLSITQSSQGSETFTVYGASQLVTLQVLGLPPGVQPPSWTVNPVKDSIGGTSDVLTITTTGTTAPGTYPITVDGRGIDGQTGTAHFSLTVLATTPLIVSITPTTLTTTSTATITASGGTPNGQFSVYAISTANAMKYQLYPTVTVFGATGTVATTVNLANSPTLTAGSYTVSIEDVASGKTANGNTFTITSPQYTVTFAVAPLASSGSTAPTGSQTYSAGTQVQISATAAPGYTFSSWSSSSASITIACSTCASTTMTVNGAGTITANFQPSSSGGPTLVQESQTTCSYVCSSGQDSATFSSQVQSGDMLVITVVEDDQPTLTVTDTLGTMIQLAVGSHTSQSQNPVCGSPSTYCQADIYWGILKASGVDTVTVTEPGSNAAIRLQIWEFKGVNEVENTASCLPTCASTAYPASSILLATGSTVTGAGAGFTWYVYTASGVAGSELMFASTAGSTTFPFSPAASLEEDGVVLTEGSGSGSPLAVSIAPTTLILTSTATITGSGGTPNGQYLVYAINSANSIRYQLYPSVTSFNSSGKVTSSVNLANSPSLIAGSYTMFIEDVASGNTATGNAFTIQASSSGGPALVQQTANTCSSPCSGSQTTAAFPSAVMSGDMLVVTVVSDDLTNLQVSDSLGTTFQLAVSATEATGCTSNSGSCQADVYWGIIASAGADTLRVSEPSSSVALRVQGWEFTGVNSIGSTFTCGPSCSSASAYPASSVLIATARDETGGGSGFTFDQYVASGIAGTEYEIASSAGSTSFPFSSVVDDVEAGVVLTESSGSSTPTIVQTCSNAAVPPLQQDPSFTCALTSPVTQGDMIVVEVSDVAPAIADSQGNTYTLLTSVPVPTSTYDLYVYYTFAKASGTDDVYVVGQGNYPGVLIHEIKGAASIGAFSTGSGTSATPAVTSYTPPSNSLVIAAAQESAYQSWSAGPGYSLLSQTQTGLADESAQGGTATTSQFSLGASAPWCEISFAVVS
ncbi:MAG: hypothetical protein OK456_05695 [Thaumarchaeota archaeon]|nr:hypothetical protein [Nitrososphaerota archaeon]